MVELLDHDLVEEESSLDGAGVLAEAAAGALSRDAGEEMYRAVGEGAFVRACVFGHVGEE